MDKSSGLKAAPAADKSPSTSISEVESLRLQVKALTAENQALKKEIATVKKRAAIAAESAGPPAKKARTVSQKKKLFEKWINALTRESKKSKITNSYGCPDPYNVTVKDAAVWSPQEFQAMFGGYGTKIQPTPDNKPTSVITILRFEEYDDIKSFFTSVGGVDLPEEGYQVQIWRKRNFAKSVRCEDRSAKLSGLEVHYNKSKQQLSFVYVMWTDPTW